MANYRVRNALLWGSELPESAYNTPYSAAADFEALSSKEAFFLLPTIEKVSDAGNVGTGSHFPTHLCNDYWTQPGINLLTDVEFFGFFSKLWLRAFGGTVAVAASGDGFKHTAPLLTGDNTVLPASDLIALLGTDSPLFAGMVVSQATMAMQRGQRYQMVGSGKHTTPHGVSGSLPTFAPPSVCGSNRINVKYTNASSVVVDLGASGCQFVDFSVSLNNQLAINDRCPGDPSLTQNGGTANHFSRVPRQDQTLDILMTFLKNETNAEYLQHLAGTNITALTIAIQGPEITPGGAATLYETGIEVPKAHFGQITPAENQGNAALQMGITVVFDPAAAYIARAFAVNGVATDFR
jgi:hypothetical protein